MRIHDLGPRSEVAYPASEETRWGLDYGPRAGGEGERPYIDNHPAFGRGEEGRSRWGSRPVRDVEREFEPGRPAEKGFFHYAWTRVWNAVRYDG